MGRTPSSEVEVPQTDIVDAMPVSTRAGKSRTYAVQVLVESLQDGKVHRLKNVTPENKDKWIRKIRYAARQAGIEKPSITYIDPSTAKEDEEPGVYFRGPE